MYFTTNDVAQMCNVTRQTVINWIKSRKLNAILTPGGHRRVLKEDLVKFFIENNLDTDVIEEFEEKRKKRIPYCWEYFAMGFAGKDSRHECQNCIVKAARAQKCFVLAPIVREKGAPCNQSCEGCAYLKRYPQLTE